MAALVLYLVLAILLYGSLYMAVGAACSELKDAQSLMMPVMILSMFPIFVWTAVLTNPSSTLSVGMSLFPPASPYLMLMRLAMRPSPPAWQVGLSIVGTTLTALFCVWAAGQDLPHRAPDAGQGPELSRAGAVGDGEVSDARRKDRFRIANSGFRTVMKTAGSGTRESGIRHLRRVPGTSPDAAGADRSLFRKGRSPSS